MLTASAANLSAAWERAGSWVAWSRAEQSAGCANTGAERGSDVQVSPTCRHATWSSTAVAGATAPSAWGSGRAIVRSEGSGQRPARAVGEVCERQRGLGRRQLLVSAQPKTRVVVWWGRRGLGRRQLLVFAQPRTRVVVWWGRGWGDDNYWCPPSPGLGWCVVGARDDNYWCLPSPGLGWSCGGVDVGWGDDNYWCLPSPGLGWSCGGGDVGWGDDNYWCLPSPGLGWSCGGVDVGWTDDNYWCLPSPRLRHASSPAQTGRRAPPSERTIARQESRVARAVAPAIRSVERCGLGRTGFLDRLASHQPPATSRRLRHIRPAADCGTPRRYLEPHAALRPRSERSPAARRS